MVMRTQYFFQSLTEHFNTSNLAGFGCEELGPSLSAAGAIISYLNETHKSALKHITKVRRHISDGTLLMDRHTFSSLELTTVVGDGKEDNSLFGVIDRTVTPMGTRLLREWVLAPLNKVEGKASVTTPRAVAIFSFGSLMYRF